MVKRRRLKRFFFVFSVLLSLITLNVGLFTIGASANAVDYPGTFTQFVTGVPLNVDFFSYADPGEYYDGVLHKVTNYLYDYNGTRDWVGGFDSDHLVTFSYGAVDTSSADTIMTYRYPTNCDFSLDGGLIFIDRDELNTNYDCDIGVYSPKSHDGDLVTSVRVRYSYTFVTASSEDPFSLTSETVSGNVIYDTSGGFFKFDFFNNTVLSNSVIESYRQFVGTDGVSYAYLQSARAVLDDGSQAHDIYATDYFFDPSNDSALEYDVDYVYRLNARYRSIYDAETFNDVTVNVTENVNFDDLSWTDWLVNAVGGFLDFQIVPGLSFAGMLGLLVGMSLFVVFLKVFAGG